MPSFLNEGLLRWYSTVFALRGSPHDLGVGEACAGEPSDLGIPGGEVLGASRRCRLRARSPVARAHARPARRRPTAVPMIISCAVRRWSRASRRRRRDAAHSPNSRSARPRTARTRVRLSSGRSLRIKRSRPLPRSAALARASTPRASRRPTGAYPSPRSSDSFVRLLDRAGLAFVVARGQEVAPAESARSGSRRGRLLAGASSICEVAAPGQRRDGLSWTPGRPGGRRSARLRIANEATPVLMRLLAGRMIRQ